MKSVAIVDRLNCFVNSLPIKFYHRPAKKFVREFIAGMMISKSTVLTNIVRSWSTNKDDFQFYSLEPLAHGAFLAPHRFVLIS